MQLIPVQRILHFLLGSKQKPYQYTHHAVLLVGAVGYLLCSVFNIIFQTADPILARVQLVLFALVLLIWYLSRWRDQFRSMALLFIFLLVLVALPVNWIYNSGLAGPTYFLNLTTLAYINVAFRDYGIYRKIGSVLTIVLPLLLMQLDLYRPELIFQYPNDLVRGLDLGFSFVITSVLLMVMMSRYSRHYQLERDKAEYLAEQLRLLSEQDPLTGLHNRRALDRYLEHLNQERRCYSLAILDLDHFKKLNDSFGHSYGDEVLCLCARQLIRTAQKSKGLAVRLGGEEFVLVLPMAEIQARQQIRTLADELQQLALKHGPVTFSAGVAQADAEESQDELLARADQYLYAAKAAGRNRVFSAADLIPAAGAV